VLSFAKPRLPFSVAGVGFSTALRVPTIWLTGVRSERTRAAEGYLEEDVGDFSRKQHSQEWRHWRLTKSLGVYNRYISSVAIVKGAKRCGKVVISP
jgi:hypothetical protein